VWVVPCCDAGMATAVAVSAAEAVEKFAPSSPVQMVSTKPGTTVTAPRSRSAGRGGAPVPTHPTVVCETSLHPVPQQFSAGEQGCQPSTHSDALPFRLGQVGLLR